MIGRDRLSRNGRWILVLSSEGAFGCWRFEERVWSRGGCGVFGGLAFVGGI